MMNDVFHINESFEMKIMRIAKIDNDRFLTWKDKDYNDQKASTRESVPQSSSSKKMPVERNFLQRSVVVIDLESKIKS